MLQRNSGQLFYFHVLFVKGKVLAELVMVAVSVILAMINQLQDAAHYF